MLGGGQFWSEILHVKNIRIPPNSLHYALFSPNQAHGGMRDQVRLCVWLNLVIYRGCNVYDLVI